MAGHIQELGKVEGRARRQYLESNAEAIVFDTYALLSSLKTHAEYQNLRAALARTRSTDDESEGKLFDLITRRTPSEIEDSLREIRLLTESLVRELRIIAELPGRATVPLTKKRKDAKASRFTCRQLLETIEPLADMLQPAVEMPAVPETVCAPKELEFDPYLHVLRWFLEDGEALRSVAFPYQVGTHNVTGVVPAILAKRVDASWDALEPGKAGAIVEKLVSSTFVAVTDRRIITADPRDLLREGELGQIYPLNKVQYVRPPSRRGEVVRPTIDVITEQRDLHWMFPETAAHEDIDCLAAILSEGATHVGPAPAATAEPASQSAAIDS